MKTKALSVYVMSSDGGLLYLVGLVCLFVLMLLEAVDIKIVHMNKQMCRKM